MKRLYHSQGTKEEHPVEFGELAHCFEELEGTNSRLTLIELLTQLFRSIEQPDEIETVLDALAKARWNDAR
jgi:hypothetical protein